MSTQVHPGELTDQELVSKVASQDRDAFLALYDRFAPRMLGLIRTVLPDRAAAEDVLQEVMFEVWSRHAARYNPVLGAADAWLLRLARSRAIDRVRRESRRAAAPDDELHSAFARTIAPDAPEDVRALRIAITELSDDERTPLLLAYAHGYSREQIADHLQIPVGTVKTRLRRAVQRLGELMSQAGAVSP